MNSSLSVETVVNGTWKQNCYLVSNQQKQLIIVDPGSEPDKIISHIHKTQCKPLAILNTHAHYDHIGAVSALLKAFQIPFYLHIKDEKLMKQANVYKIFFESKESVFIPKFDQDLSLESENLVLGDFDISVLHTPGHTSGSTCFLLSNFLFSGDTILPNGPGGTYLPGGNEVELATSLVRLRELPKDYLVYPGHGRPFTLKKFWDLTDG
jgi:hydroxyacylglutathione hydrolase